MCIVELISLLTLFALLIYIIYQNQIIITICKKVKYYEKTKLNEDKTQILEDNLNNNFKSNFKNKNDNPIMKIYGKFQSYSEQYEDLILYGVFYDKNEGFYIDVGANSPTISSVTKAFYERGWNGINIEPLLQYAGKELILERPRDINLAVCAGEKEGKATLYVKGMGSASSTLDKRYNNNYNNTLKITVLPMSTITKLHVPKNKEVDFCKIDVEGSEKQVLLGYDFINYRPKVFCIESTKPESNIPTENEWEDILIQNKYSFAYKYGINRFYVDDKVKGLKERFIGVDKLKKKFME